MERDFSTAYKRALQKREVEKIQSQQPKKIQKSRWEICNTTIDDVLKLMEIKAQMGVFQTFNPRDFGADYDFTPIPKDNTPEADFWLTNK